MKITILGTGAMASTLGAQLSFQSDVTLLGTWTKAINAIHGHGLTLKSEQGDLLIPLKVTQRPEDCADSDLLIVLVKSWQTHERARWAAPCLSPGGLVLTLQNGLGNVETLEKIFGPRVIAGVTTLGATLVGPALVRSTGQAAIELAGHPRLGLVRSLFTNIGFDVVERPSLPSLIWGKLVINAAINPLGAFLRKTNGELADSPHLARWMGAIAEETARVATALGIILPYEQPAQEALRVARASASNRSSMLQDMEKGRPTEIDSISGAIVRHALRVGLKAPLNETLWQLIRNSSPIPLARPHRAHAHPQNA
ncbi:MAG: 2-dehydropantoate 2-reductase [Elusimicrobiota bacterium]